jgi:pyrroline-5-carboxylate reductase
MLSDNARASAYPAPLWLVGCGNMAGAMLHRWLDAGMDPAQVTVIRPSGAPVAPGVRVLTEAPAGETPAMLMLGTKPQILDQVAPSIIPALGTETILISILAGAEVASLRARFPVPRTIVRAMPNTPVALGKGSTILFAEGGDPAALATVERLMRPLGLVEWIQDEHSLDIVTALTASGPAFIFRFISALADGAVALGMDREQAQRLAIVTVEGAAALASASNENPRELADRVASPGGTTRAGLNVLDSDDRLRRLVHETFQASVSRELEMRAEARRS